MTGEHVGDKGGGLIRGLRENFPKKMILQTGSRGKKDDWSARQEG